MLALSGRINETGGLKAPAAALVVAAAAVAARRGGSGRHCQQRDVTLKRSCLHTTEARER